MTGVGVDPSFENPLDQIAYQDDNGQWRAGPDAKGYESGQFVPQEGDDLKGNVARARSMRKYKNDVKRTMRRHDDMNQEEAMELVNEYREMKDKFENGEISEAEFNEWIADHLES